MAARASTDRGVGRLASRWTTDREKTKPGCLTARARENPLIYETSYALGSLLLKLDMQELPPRIAQRSRLSITTSAA
jgi:hypothetical protein